MDIRCSTLMKLVFKISVKGKSVKENEILLVTLNIAVFKRKIYLSISEILWLVLEK